MIKISPAAFESAFRRFMQLVARQPGSHAPFKSFKEGVPSEWESYKGWVYDEARRYLDAHSWKTTDIGSGDILTNTLNAIKIHKTETLRNNLVQWDERYGSEAVSQKKMEQAIGRPDVRRDIEAVLYDLFVSLSDPEECFDRLVPLLGARYDLLAYLFYLRDPTRFMPIKPEIFQEAFKALGIDYDLSGRCSWENYTEYLRRLESVQDMLNRQDIVPEIKGQVRLIDAHSFCWMLVEMK